MVPKHVCVGGGQQQLTLSVTSNPTDPTNMHTLKRCSLSLLPLPSPQVFTSMDVKAITSDRVRAMSLEGEAELVGRLQALGTAVYSSLNLTSLVRLDIRADEDGELYILVSGPFGGGVLS